METRILSLKRVKLQSSYICGENKNQTKNNEAHNGTKIGNYLRTEPSTAAQKRSIPRTNSCRWNAFAISKETGWKIDASAPRRFTHCPLRLPRRRFRNGDGRVGSLPTRWHCASGRNSNRNRRRGAAAPVRVCRENRGWSTAWWGAVACVTAK